MILVLFYGVKSDKAEELPGHAQTVMEDFDDDVGVTIKKEIGKGISLLKCVI